VRLYFIFPTPSTCFYKRKRQSKK